MTFATSSVPSFSGHLAFTPQLPEPLAAFPPDVAADVWFKKNDPAIADPKGGSEGFLVVLHEMGHALGLSHDGTSSPTVTADGSFRFPAVPIPPAEANFLLP
jgi:hypothetical protein